MKRGRGHAQNSGKGSKVIRGGVDEGVCAVPYNIGEGLLFLQGGAGTVVGGASDGGERAKWESSAGKCLYFHLPIPLPFSSWPSLSLSLFSGLPCTPGSTSHNLGSELPGSHQICRVYCCDAGLSSDANWEYNLINSL